MASEVENGSIECKGLGFNSSWGLSFFFISCSWQDEKTSFAVLIKLLLNFQVSVRGYMFFLLGKKLFWVNFVKKSEHYEVELELNGRGISELRKILWYQTIFNIIWNYLGCILN